MPILNQTDTGMPCPDDVDAMKRAIESRNGKSYFQHIKVHAFQLAKVLDRLEYLERFESHMKDVLKSGVPYK